jgi:zinc protease
MAFFAVPNDGVPFEKIEQLIDGVIADVAANGITEAELDRAKKSYLAEYIYQSDNQASLARRYGWALTVGATIKDVEEWPDRLSKITAEQAKAAVRHLDILRSVTGVLLPEAPDQPPGSRS